MNAKDPKKHFIFSEGEVVRQENCQPPITSLFQTCTPHRVAVEDLQFSVFTFFLNTSTLTFPFL